MELDLDEFLPAIRAGDPEAFGRWVAGAELPLRRALRKLADQVDVEAVVQEALLRVWQVAPRVLSDGKPNCLLRFAHTTARNCALDELRRRRVAPADVDAHERALVAAGERALASPPDPHLRDAIRQCREALPRQPAAALSARIESTGLESDAELAAQLRMRPNTFLKNIGRARALLAQCLRRRGIDLALELA